MDALKAEIANKRKALGDEPNNKDSNPTVNKYMRRGDIDKLKDENERSHKRQQQDAAERERKEAALNAAKAIPLSDTSIPQSSSSSTPEPSAATPDDAAVAETFNITNPETIRRLRSKGQPIRLFAETDKERRLRLRALELIEGTEKGEKGQGRGGHNDFRRAMEGVERGEAREEDRSLIAADVAAAAAAAREKGGPDDDGGIGPAVSGGKSRRLGGDTEMEGVLDLSLVKSDPDKLYPIIYYALKRTLKEWGQAMDERPENIKRTTQGKLAAATQVQSAEYLKPLFKALRSRALPADVLARMAEIVHHMQNRQYQRANDSYLRLSIGNAPWPIGVTMVGIHERSAREKISSDQVAHVLNDEVSRKYIQSLKRLLTFSQTKYPPADISQLMG